MPQPFSVDPKEEVLVKCPITFRLRPPLEMTPKKRDAYLTSNRLLIEDGKELISVPFEWMLGLRLLGDEDTGKVIEIHHGKKLRFSALPTQPDDDADKKTERLYNWLYHMAAGPKRADKVIKDIKAKKGKV